MLRRLLGIDRLDDRIRELENEVQDLDEIRDRQAAIAAEVEDISQEYVSGSELDDRLESVVDEIQDMVERLDAAEENEDQDADLSPTETNIVGVFLRRDGYVSVQDIASDLDKSEGTIRKYMSMLRDKIDFELRQEGRQKKYKLPEDVEKEVLEEGRLIGREKRN